MNLLKTIAIVFLLISCNKKEEFDINTFHVNGGWGYAIKVNHKTIIKQTVIPTSSKTEVFKTKSDALKVGNLVLERIKHKLSPTITQKDLILLEISF